MSSVEVSNITSHIPPFATDEEAMAYRINKLTQNLLIRNNYLCREKYNIAELIAHSGVIKSLTSSYYWFAEQTKSLEGMTKDIAEEHYKYMEELYNIEDKETLQSLDDKLVNTLRFIGGKFNVPTVEMLTRNGSESIIRFRECLKQEALRISNENRDKLIIAKENIEAEMVIPGNLTDEEIEEQFNFVKEMIEGSDGYETLDAAVNSFKQLVDSFALILLITSVTLPKKDLDRFTDLYNKIMNKSSEMGAIINKTVSEKAKKIYKTLELDEAYIDKFVTYNNQKRLLGIYDSGIEKMNNVEHQIINDELPLYNIEYLRDNAKEIEGISPDDDSDYSKEVIAWLEAEEDEDLKDKQDVIREGISFKMYFVEATALDILGVNKMSVADLMESSEVVDHLFNFLNLDKDKTIDFTDTLEEWVKSQSKLGENDLIYNANDPLSIIDPEWNNQEESRGISGRLFDAAHYRFDPDQKIFYTTTEAFQKYLGYYDMYDEMCSIGPLFRIDYLVVPNVIDSKGVPWNIRAWKGNYWGAAGAEIGAYSGTSLFGYKEALLEEDEQANGARDDNMLVMGFTLKEGNNTLFTRYPEPNWWVIGMKPLQNGAYVDKRGDNSDNVDGYTLEGTINFGHDDFFSENFIRIVGEVAKNENKRITINSHSGNVIKFTWIGE